MSAASGRTTPLSSGKPPQTIAALWTQYRAGFVLALACAAAAVAALGVYFALALRAAVPGVDVLARFVVPFVSGAAALVGGLAILRARRSEPLALLVSGICALAAIALAGLYDLQTSRALVGLWALAACLTAGGLVALALAFPPSAGGFTGRQTWAWFVPLVVSALVGIALALTGNAGFAQSVMLGALLALAASLLYRRARLAAPLVRDQSNVVLIGIMAALIPLLVWLFDSLVVRPLMGTAPAPFSPNTGAPFFVLFLLSLVYVAAQARLNDADRLTGQAVTYGILLAALVAGYFLLVLGASLLAGRFVGADNVPLMALAIFVVAALFLPARAWLQAKMDARYFKARRNYQPLMDAFAQKLPTLVGFDELIGEYRRQIQEGVAASQVFVFLPDAQSGDYAAFGGETDVRFAADSPLAALLREGDGFIYLEPGRAWASALLAERARLQILRAQVIVVLRGGDRLNGFVCVGAPGSGQAGYTYQALRFVQTVTQQVSVAVERAQVVNSLERRVRELDVLSQVSQAANFTIRFDDLLELLSAQTGKLLAASHFYITLRERGGDELYHAFFLENDERYPEKENRRWRIGADLFSEVVRTGRAARVADYRAAMSERGSALRDEDPQLKAWMGVPLIAGTQTIGVMATGTTQPSAIFTDDQLKILSDIGALAATAIDKARLFEETTSRARQLAALNDISRRLVATESNLEQLLELITSSAVDILNTEAGSLLLTADDESGDLEFKVVTGGYPGRLSGRRLAKGYGLIGQAAETGEPVVSNRAQSDPRWSGEITLSGNFMTNSVLAVPLKTQNQVIGVLEVVNRRDGGMFAQEDADLLATFAGQAAVAIENARLFQLTDIQLSARVSELEMLERIDVELNRSLDLATVADITVRYAMEQTGAAAGLLGVVEPDGHHMKVVALLGYEAADLPAGAQGGLLPLDRGIVSRVMRTRRAELVTDVSTDPDYTPSLRDGKSQITVPMLAAGNINAILLLESSREPGLSLAHMAFVQRLAEHASVAIANAQLYAELERANQSKSEFVSFVAHELRNPLTSIKGYADVLLSGAVGGVSEQQKAFLSTIRSNSDRMNTLISDLNDVTKLQTDNLRMEFAPVDFRALLADTLRPLQKQLDDKGQRVEVSLPDDLPQIQADRSRLIQVLTNLVSNAHKYSPQGSAIAIRAGVSEDGAALEVRVKDSGIGMSADDLARLSTPYFRSENPAAREQPGTGLGLTITYGIIERHGGEVRVESEPGKGTTFTFTVPVAG